MPNRPEEQKHFYPRSPYGERRIKVSILFTLAEFLSTLSLRRATVAGTRYDRPPLYFYPRSPYGERLFRQNYECFEWIISIHALLTESDPKYHRILPRHNAFLSTLSLRRATTAKIRILDHIFNFYPRSPYGERQCSKPAEQTKMFISIHALLTESDYRLGAGVS